MSCYQYDKGLKICIQSEEIFQAYSCKGSRGIWNFSFSCPAVTARLLALDCGVSRRECAAVHCNHDCDFEA